MEVALLDRAEDHGRPFNTLPSDVWQDSGDVSLPTLGRAISTEVRVTTAATRDAAEAMLR